MRLIKRIYEIYILKTFNKYYAFNRNEFENKQFTCVYFFFYGLSLSLMPDTWVENLSHQKFEHFLIDTFLQN